jgi:predicted Zn-dependent protease with MMP-like domain
MKLKEFERLVGKAISRIPKEIREHMKNMAIVIEKRPSPELLEEMNLEPDETLFGLYTGIPLPERSAFDPPLYPDQILIFKEPLEEFCRTPGELEEEIEITVAHEVAHYLGMSEEELADLGYA